MKDDNFIIRFLNRKKTWKDYLLLSISIALTIFLVYNYDSWVAKEYDLKNPQLCNRSYEVIYSNSNTTVTCFMECFKIYGCNSTVGKNGRLYKGTCVCDGIEQHQKDRLGFYNQPEYYISENGYEEVLRRLNGSVE